jgi:hypothetical protein
VPSFDHFWQVWKKAQRQALFRNGISHVPPREVRSSQTAIVSGDPCDPAGDLSYICAKLHAHTPFDGEFRPRLKQDPNIIAVDIDTSHQKFKGFNPQFKGSDGKSIPIVWERDVPAGSEIDTPVFQPLDILGSQDPKLNKNSGILASICASNPPRRDSSVVVCAICFTSIN